MCWSLEVSLATSAIVAAAVVFLWARHATRRDGWNAIFLMVFGSMQVVDAFLWSLSKEEDLSKCSDRNHNITYWGFWVIMLEPIACLLGRAYFQQKLPSWKEIVTYVCLFTILPQVQESSCKSASCTMFTPEGHLILGCGQDQSGYVNCWRQNIFYGHVQAEIPLVLRFFFLCGMVYPYLSAIPRATGLMQSAILTVTWLFGYFSDSHASVWCLANVAQVITMVLDPYLFPPHKQGSPIKRSKRQTITQDRFSRTAVPENLDAIVVGSGIGGLATAAVLAKSGKKVLVLEQHYRAGGCTHTFDEVGNNLFDSGIHYVGSRGTIETLLAYISDFYVRFVPMGSDKDDFTYDEFDLGGTIVTYQSGRKELEAGLIRAFPHEEEGIRKYMKAVYDAQSATDAFAALKILPKWLLNLGIKSWLYKYLSGYVQVTAAEKVAEFVQDKKLQALLSGGQLIDWNLEPDRTAWWVVAGMMNYYADGGFYPEGGSHRIAEAIIPIIERAGGRVLCRAKVDAILVDDSTTAYGVRVNGMEIKAPIVVSDAGAVNTYEKLLAPEVVKSIGLSPTLPTLKASHGHITAFVCLDNTAEHFKLRPANMHSMPALDQYDNDISKMQRAFYADPFCQEEPLITLTCPSAKDPMYPELYPNTSNVLLLMEAKWEWFEKIEAKNYGNRAQEYKDFKEKFEKMFTDRLFKYYPQCKGHVTSIEIGTPLTTQHFLAAPQGGSYGLEWTCEHFSEKLQDTYFEPVTRVNGLYLTGEASLFGGFAGALASGFISAYKILGLPRFLWTLAMSEYVTEEEKKSEQSGSKKARPAKAHANGHATEVKKDL